MKISRLDPFSLFAGLAFGALALVTTGQSPAQEHSFEYKIVVDVSESDVASMAKVGWEFVGYLGQSPRGTSSDETLWRRASH